MSTLLVDYDLPENITIPTWLESWHTEPIAVAATEETLDALAARTYSDIAHEPADEVRDLIRAVRAAIAVRRAELTDLAEAHAATVVAWVEERRARSRRHGYHVLPHHEGGYLVERDGVALTHCSTRREAQEARDALAAAAGARESA